MWQSIAQWSKKYEMWAFRIALFVIYFWFGILKLLDLSPATPLVLDLQQMVMPFVSYDTFIIPFSLFEMLIGVLALWPRATKALLVLLVVHFGMIFSPIVLVPQHVWSGWFVLTLEGQYIIKNLILIATAMYLAARVDRTSHVA
jgi:uncharacterized membrane protein YkgB